MQSAGAGAGVGIMSVCGTAPRPECGAEDAFESIAQAASHVQEALRMMDFSLAGAPVCAADRPRIFPPVIPPAAACPAVSYPAGCCAFPSRAYSSVIPQLAPCPTCVMAEHDAPAATAAAPCCAHRHTVLGRLLLRATLCGRSKEVRKLLRAGADVNFEGAGRWTPLHKAAERAYADLLWLLLKRGAEPNARNCNGYSPLHLAACNDCCGLCVSLLACAGADLDCRNESGQTPLHVAAEAGNEAAVRALVASGAKRFVKNNQGRTPFDVAEGAPVRRLLVCRGLHPIALY